jgi:hypothetical protein
MPEFKSNRGFKMKGFQMNGNPSKKSPFYATIAKEKGFEDMQDKPVPKVPVKPLRQRVEASKEPFEGYSGDEIENSINKLESIENPSKEQQDDLKYYKDIMGQLDDDKG